MIRNYRAWKSFNTEPDGFPIAAASAESAAAAFVTDFDDLDTDELEKSPILILVREEDSPRQEPHRIRVTASTEVTVWGYPESAT